MEEFNKNFIDYNYMSKIRQLIDERRQKEDEASTSFINDMEYLMQDAYP